MSKKIEIVKVQNEGDFISYRKVDIDDYFCRGGACSSGGAAAGERALTHSFVMDVLRKVMGKTLTIIDASIQDKTQNKAIKDLLRQVISDEMEFTAEWGFDQEVITELADKSFQAMSEEEQTEVLKSSVSIEEALGVEESK